MIDKEVLDYTIYRLEDVCDDISKSWIGIPDGLAYSINVYNSLSVVGFVAKFPYLKADDLIRLIDFSNETGMRLSLSPVVPDMIKVRFSWGEI